MATRRSVQCAVLTAAALLVPLGGVAVHAAGGPTEFTGIVHRPDGLVAQAAAVDLSIAGAAPFARGVSNTDGHFVVDVPETSELVALALAQGGSLTVQWTASDLYAQTEATLPALHTSPGFAQAVGEFTARLVDTATETVATALSDPAVVEFRLPDTAADPIVTRVRDLAGAAAIFADPDMVRGLEDLDDPDLVPPLGVVVDELTAVLDGGALAGSATVPADPTRRGIVAETLAGLPETMLSDDDGDDGTPRCDKDPGTYWWRKDLGNTPAGTTTYAYLDTYSCVHDRDKYRDEIGYRWEGYTGAVDSNWRIWRLKFRSEAYENSGYLRKRPQPTGNVEASKTTTVSWNVGFSYVAQAYITGTYHFKAKKIHPWFSDDYGRLFHVSWISDKKTGSPGGGFNNGGGFIWDVPEGADGRAKAVNTVTIWRCSGNSCDGNR